jgi:hypothetical protein
LAPPSDECPRGDETPLGLTAENKWDFSDDYRNQENERESRSSIAEQEKQAVRTKALDFTKKG